MPVYEKTRIKAAGKRVTGRGVTGKRVVGKGASGTRLFGRKTIGTGYLERGMIVMELQRLWVAGVIWLSGVISGLKMRLRDVRGQGTVEYAILVGVLVVIAILAVVAFRGKLQQLWETITSGINNL